MSRINLTEQKILVTGGAGAGIGSGICEALHACGATLIINDVDQNSLDNAANKYPAALTINADIRGHDAIESMFKRN